MIRIRVRYRVWVMVSVRLGIGLGLGFISGQPQCVPPFRSVPEIIPTPYSPAISTSCLTTMLYSAQD